MKLPNKENARFAVIGSGSWATALVKVLLETQALLGWYVRDPRMIEQIKESGHNPRYLQSAELDVHRLAMSADINQVINEADILLFCIPSAYFLQEMMNLQASLKNKFILSSIKGLLPERNISVTEYFHTVHKIPYDNLGMVAGPVHAEEVAMKRLSYLTVTTKKEAVATALAQAFASDYMHTNVCTDIYGVEYAVVLKNIYAIAAGICRSLGYGDNFLAVLAAASFSEMRLFLNRTHPDKNRNTARSAYLGDLLVTAYSQFSRNRTFGSMIGKGYSVRAAQLEMDMVAEGYYATACVYEINKKHKVPMPIAEAMYKILYEYRSPAIIIKTLTNQLK